MAKSLARHRILVVALGAVLSVVAIGVWRAEPRQSSGPLVATLRDGTQGRVSFVSSTIGLSDIQDGAAVGTPVTISGDLILPKGRSGTLPAAILLHGSDGLSDHQYRYAESLAEWGIAAFVLDSFKPRGVETTVGDQDAVSPYSMLADAYAALALLATHPRIDPDRIALIGWSKGGLVADWASRKRLQKRLARQGRRFAAHAAFYPWCGEQDFKTALTGAPMLYLLGQEDDWSGSQACVDYAERLTKSGYEAHSIVYANAAHGFDYMGRFRNYLPQADSWKDCAYFVRAKGYVIASTGRFEKWSKFKNYVKRCATKGAHAGSNVDARKRALADLKNFLARALGN